ncbi:hypothetical protein CEV31_0175 [Brucella thiophenivorans]|uniref:Uncharacterized protein n=1 Tax=Brucella thiophenivorans TaxID=571255 RepID=A0A256G6D1_9HYPH|nr:hypothetical protein CEV31_0175 [Brucella thiophenivorans]
MELNEMVPMHRVRSYTPVIESGRDLLQFCDEAFSTASTQKSESIFGKSDA